MKIQLLPTTFDQNGCATQQQHSCCFVIDDCVAVDAGSLAMSATSRQKDRIRDVILTHAHLDHIAGLPLFLDDLFAVLKQPVCVHAEQQVIEILERDVFNWSIYPRFSELKNEFGEILSYHPFDTEVEFQAAHLTVKSVSVNHKVPTVGVIVSDGNSNIAISSDTAETEKFWELVNEEDNLSAIFIECAFPNNLTALACSSHHLTPNRLKNELAKIKNKNCPVYAINLKPMYREIIVKELEELEIKNLSVLRIGDIYNF